MRILILAALACALPSCASLDGLALSYSREVAGVPVTVAYSGGKAVVMTRFGWGAKPLNQK